MSNREIETVTENMGWLIVSSLFVKVVWKCLNEGTRIMLTTSDLSPTMIYSMLHCNKPMIAQWFKNIWWVDNFNLHRYGGSPLVLFGENLLLSLKKSSFSKIVSLEDVIVSIIVLIRNNSNDWTYLYFKFVEWLVFQTRIG